MIIIGITGSIGMGKTTVSSMFRSLNISVFDSDKEVKNILENNIEIIKKIEKKWPEVISSFPKEKKIDKKILSDKVFNKNSDKKTLEKIIHPVVKEKRKIFMKENKKSYFVVLDVPLLYETGTHRECDYVFLVNTSIERQKRRVLARPHMTEKKFDQINNTQWSFERKKSKKPFLISTSFGKVFSFITILIYLLIIILKNKVNNGKRISPRH